MSNEIALRRISRDGYEWEQVAWAELLVPDTPNVYGDVYTREAIVGFRDAYMEANYGLDLEHDGEDIRNTGYYIVESFIAREGDPDFIPGSWVLGVKVLDSDIWNRILTGDLNGFSFEALVGLEPITLLYSDEMEQVLVHGTTEPDPFDGHTHSFSVVLGPLNKVISGSTGETDGHFHPITTHTVTGHAAGHNHRFQVLGD
ncbi:protease [Pseudomonas phage SM1]|uniref:DNA replication protein n=2 Tax=Samunavirus TaxID=2560221 RepID=A0AAU8L0V6_9CAUD|nr:protease [Pseudomonas phage SM1]UGC97035.1 hypothetical protein [Pseudomonas phage BHU-1]UGV19992.1 hypothetical protein [Pseudomonas phage Pa BHU-15]UIW13555.1 hypothetical protein [Pseudomonas phage Pa BHU-17]UVN14042.1 hypothetical protein FBPa45_0040 [Pseudomonas phage vB_PaeS_FBPa45]WDS62444.1 hypothetical protein UFRH6_14 [Pseudomonas phage UF_RH6]HBO9768523.1 hypothetical protein [Pseudomonas aeruginosa]